MIRRPPQMRWTGRMGEERGDAAGDIERAGAFPMRQFGIPRGLRAPAPVVFQLGGMGIVKGLASALRKPRAMPQECREFVFNHMIIQVGQTIAFRGLSCLHKATDDARRSSVPLPLTISCRTFRSTSRRCARGAPAFRGGGEKYRSEERGV